MVIPCLCSFLLTVPSSAFSELPINKKRTRTLFRKESGSSTNCLVDGTGLEPVTSCTSSRCSTSWANRPYSVASWRLWYDTMTFSKKQYFFRKNSDFLFWAPKKGAKKPRRRPKSGQRRGENRENYSFASGKPSSFEVQWGQRTALIEISLWQ